MKQRLAAIFCIVSVSLEAYCSICVGLFLPTRSELSKQSGLEYFVHSTPIENLKAILSSGELKVGKESGQAGMISPIGLVHDGIFLQSVLRRDLGQNINYLLSSNISNMRFESGGSFSRVILIFNPDLVSRTDYHATNRWAYGQFISPISSRPENIDSFIRQQMVSFARERDEYVFQNSISLSELIGIIVHPSRAIDLQSIISSVPEVDQKILIFSRTEFVDLQEQGI